MMPGILLIALALILGAVGLTSCPTATTCNAHSPDPIMLAIAALVLVVGIVILVRRRAPKKWHP